MLFLRLLVGVFTGGDVDRDIVVELFCTTEMEISNIICTKHANIWQEYLSLTDGTAGCFPGGVGEVGEVLGFVPPAFFFRRIVDDGVDVMASMNPELS